MARLVRSRLWDFSVSLWLALAIWDVLTGLQPHDRFSTCLGCLPPPVESRLHEFWHHPAGVLVPLIVAVIDGMLAAPFATQPKGRLAGILALDLAAIIVLQPWRCGQWLLAGQLFVLAMLLRRVHNDTL